MKMFSRWTVLLWIPFILVYCTPKKQKADESFSLAFVLQQQNEITKDIKAGNQENALLHYDAVIAYYLKHNKIPQWVEANLTAYDSLSNWQYNREEFYNDSAIKQRIVYLKNIAARQWLKIEDTSLKKQVIKAYYNLGSDHYDNHNYISSIDAYEKYIALRNITRNKDITAADAYVFKNTGNAFVRIGDNRKGMVYLEKLYQYYSENGDDEEFAGVSIDIANVYNQLQQFDEAKQYAANALTKKNISALRKAYLDAVLAESCLMMNNTAEAMSFALKALKNIQLTETDERIESFKLDINGVLASVYARQNKIAAAKNLYDQILAAKFKYLGNKRIREIGKIQIQLGQLYEAMNLPDSALWYYHQALYSTTAVDSAAIMQVPKYEDITAENTIMEALDAKAGILRKMYNNDAANDSLAATILACYDAAFEVERKLLLNFSYDESRLDITAESRQRSEKAITLCHKLYAKQKDKKWIDRAFVFAERSKSVILLASVKQHIQSNSFLQSDSNFRQAQQLRLQVAYLKRAQFENNNDSNALHDLKEQKNTIEQQLQIAEAKVNYPQYNSWISEQDITGIETIQKDLTGKKTALAEYFYGDSAAFVFFIAEDKATMLQLKNNTGEAMDSLLYYFKDATAFANDANSYQKTAYRVYSLLELDQIIKNTEHLIVVPDGKINFIPFDALITTVNEQAGPAKFNYLIKQLSTSYIYSASVQAVQKNTAASNDITLFAPVFEKGNDTLTALQYSKTEAEHIKTLYPHGLYFTGQNATLDNFRKKGSNAGILHLASHAYSGNGNTPAQIAFIDSAVYLDEIYSMSFKTNLVVLSACETGLGELKKGEGVLSLARGFYYAGAKNVIQSLWSVNDQSTEMIFTKFYSNIKTTGFANALQNAKLTYLEQQKNAALLSPYYWAAFVYIGNTNDGIDTGNKNYFTWITGLVVSAILFLVIVRINKRRDKE